MTTGDGMRAADADRDRVATALREEMVVGRLTQDEFEERLSAAYTAKTWAQLRELVSDLPVDLAFEGEARQPAPQVGAPPVDPAAAHHPARRVPRFAPFLLIPLFFLALGVLHGAFILLIPMVIIVSGALGGGLHRSRRAHYRIR